MQSLTKLLLKWMGWTLVGSPPKLAKYIAIAAPHTTNWDFVFLLLSRFAFGIKPKFLGKHSLFKPPFGWFFSMVGGIPVNRSRSHSVVNQISELIGQYDELVLALAPEGTRSKTDHWRSGFYQIALQTGLPVQMVFIDFAKKQMGFGPLITITGDVEKDMAKFREFYSNIEGKHPEQASEIRLRPPRDK